jgi:hypothetical protein
LSWPALDRQCRLVFSPDLNSKLTLALARH